MNYRRLISPVNFVCAFVVVRFIASCTQLRAAQPDEWFATLEYANFLVNGILTAAIDNYCHLRNMTLPAIFSLPVAVSEWMSGAPYLRIVSAKLFIGLADLFIFYSVLLLTRKTTSSRAWDSWICILFLMPWFFVAESVRTALEHASAIAFWLAILFMNRAGDNKKYALFAGFFCVMTGVFRYPSGLLGVGICVAVTLRSLFTVQYRRSFAYAFFIFGIFAGIIAGGLADYFILGHPWESLWMYLQFNVFTSISSAMFGSHSAMIYLQYLSKLFLTNLFPLGLLGIIFVPIGLYYGLKRQEYWAWALLLYLLGHLVPAHKEGRFMAPVLALFLWCGFYGFYLRRASFFGVLRRSGWRKFAWGLFILTMIANTAKIAEELRGEYHKPRLNYFTALRDSADSCGLITVSRPIASWLPWENQQLVGPAVGILPVDRDWQASAVSMAQVSLLWLEREPSCTANQNIFLQLHKLSPVWEEQYHCIVSDADKIIYKCPVGILTAFTEARVTHPFVREIRRFSELPAYGLTGEELLTMCVNQDEYSRLQSHNPYTGD